MRNLLVATFILFGFLSCKKEPTTWQTDWSAPVAHGHLTLSDLIPGEYLASDGSGNMSLVYHDAVYSFTIDTLVDLPDTTIIKKSAVGVSSLNVTPGFVYTDTYDQEYLMDQIELKKVRIKSGTVDVQVACPWPGASLITCSFPKITLNSIPFERIYSMPAASISNPATSSETINLAGYFMDLTGTSGNLINYLSAEFTMGSNEATNTFTISNADSISYIISFNDLTPDYAKGYFGQYHFEDTIGISLGFMKNITTGMIDIDSISMMLTIKNGFNLIAQTKITDVKGLNSKTSGIVDLNYPMDNIIMNINPAAGNMWNHTPSEFPIAINNNNSNIAPFIENLNDSLLIGYELDINPFGNVTAGSDEVFPGSAFELYLDAEFPMAIGAEDLTIVDTFEISYDNPDNFFPENGEFSLLYSNGFPIQASAMFLVQDENHITVDTLKSSEIINAGAYNSGTFLTSPASGELFFKLNADNIANLDLAKFVIMQIQFSTDQNAMIKINTNAYFDFALKTDLKMNVSL